MALINGIAQFVDQLEKRNVPYAIIGGLAVFAYGGERTTFDVDFLIHGQFNQTVKDIAQVLNLSIANENAEVIQLSGSIDVILANRMHTQSMLKHARKIKTLPYPVVGPEDLIGLKIQAFVGDRSREFRDKGDILTLMQNVPNLDFNKIKEYADIFNVWNEIQEIKKHV